MRWCTLLREGSDATMYISGSISLVPENFSIMVQIPMYSDKSIFFPKQASGGLWLALQDSTQASAFLVASTILQAWLKTITGAAFGSNRWKLNLNWF